MKIIRHNRTRREMKSASSHSEDVGTRIRVRFLLGDDVSNDIVCFVSVSDLNKCVQHAVSKTEVLQ